MKTYPPRLGLLTTRFIFYHVFLPVFLGGLIYSCWRQPTLLIFSWYDLVGLEGIVASLRVNTQPFYGSLPHWFLFCLPDGLWVYAMTAFMAGLWVQSPKPCLIFWVALSPVLAIGGELGQLWGLVQGTYETTDILFYLAGFLLSFFVVLKKNKEITYEQNGLG